MDSVSRGVSAVTSQLSLVLILPTPKGWPGWVGLRGCQHNSNPRMVTHPSSSNKRRVAANLQTKQQIWAINPPISCYRLHPRSYSGTLLLTCSLRRCDSIGLILRIGRGWMSCFGCCLKMVPVCRSHAAPSRNRPCAKQPAEQTDFTESTQVNRCIVTCTENTLFIFGTAEVHKTEHLLSSPWCRTSVLIGSAAVRCWSSDETPWSPPLVDFQSSRRPPVAMCYCRRSVVCYCRPSTFEQSTCWRPVCLVTHISSEAENSFISAILPRHCVITTSP